MTEKSSFPHRIFRLLRLPRLRATDQAGFSYVNVMVTVAAMSIASGAVFQLYQGVTRSQSSLELVTTRKGLDEKIRDNLGDPASIAQTLQTSLALRGTLVGGCAGAAGGVLTVRDSDGRVMIPGGLDQRLQRCTSNCAFNLSARWGCRQNKYWVTVRTNYQANLNISGLNNNGGFFTTTLPVSDVQWRNALVLPLGAPRVCNAQTELMRGINPDGTPNCIPRVSLVENSRGQGQFCPPGSAVVGISNEGAPVCEDFANQLNLQVCVQMSDRGCGRQLGEERCTPCLSTLNPNDAFSSGWATDGNAYDPDCMRLAVRRCGTATHAGSGSQGQSAQQEASQNSGTISGIRSYQTPCTDGGTTITVDAGFCALSTVTAWTFGFHDTNDVNCIISPAGTRRWNLHARCHDIDVGNAIPCRMMCKD